MPDQTDFPLLSNLLRPIDDGASDHLAGMQLPRSAAGRMADFSNPSGPRRVVYCYPMTGVPGKQLPQRMG
jgi:hypothetical protein